MSFFEQAHDDVVKFADSVPGPTIDWAVREATARFLVDTEHWQYVVGPIEITEGATRYAISPPAGTQVVRAYRFVVDDKTIPPLSSAEWLEGRVAGWYVDADVLEVHPDVPRGTGRLLCALGLTPSPPEELPMQLGIDALRPVRSLALALIYDMPGKPWTDANVAQAYAGQYAQAAYALRRLANNRNAPRRSGGTIQYGGY